jgi:hypothetical protein
VREEGSERERLGAGFWSLDLCLSDHVSCPRLPLCWKRIWICCVDWECWLMDLIFDASYLMSDASTQQIRFQQNPLCWKHSKSVTLETDLLCYIRCIKSDVRCITSDPSASIPFFLSILGHMLASAFRFGAYACVSKSIISDVTCITSDPSASIPNHMRYPSVVSSKRRIEDTFRVQLLCWKRLIQEPLQLMQARRPLLSKRRRDSRMRCASHSLLPLSPVSLV